MSAKMKAVELTGLQGIHSLRVAEVDRPRPQAGEVLIQVKAAAVNFAELEMTKGRYPAHKLLPFVMGFEAAGELAGLGEGVESAKIGDRVAALATSGGFAEYAVAPAAATFPLPNGVGFAEGISIPIQGLTAYLLLKFAARLRKTDTILIQAAAGGVGLYLVQLAKLLGARRVIALVSSTEKLAFVKELGADVAIDYSAADWTERVRETTGDAGVDLVLEAAAGDVGEESFRLLAPFGRMVVFGARNIFDSFAPERVQQLIRKNLTVTGFNLPSVGPEIIGKHLPELLQLISQGKVLLFARHSFPLQEVHAAFEALASRKTIGTVVLEP